MTQNLQQNAWLLTIIFCEPEIFLEACFPGSLAIFRPGLGHQVPETIDIKKFVKLQHQILPRKINLSQSPIAPSRIKKAISLNPNVRLTSNRAMNLSFYVVQRSM